MRWITKFLQKKISKVGKKKTTNRPRLQSAAAAKVDQRPSKSLWLRWAGWPAKVSRWKAGSTSEAHFPSPRHNPATRATQRRMHRTRRSLRQSRSLRERAASSVATNRSTIGARAWSRSEARTRLTPPVLRLFCERRELGTTCLLSQQLLSRHRNDPESVTGMQTTAGGGESGGGGPQYPHHVPMDLHVPQHFPYYAGWADHQQKSWRLQNESQQKQIRMQNMLPDAALLWVKWSP